MHRFFLRFDNNFLMFCSAQIWMNRCMQQCLALVLSTRKSVNKMHYTSISWSNGITLEVINHRGIRTLTPLYTWSLNIVQTIATASNVDRTSLWCWRVSSSIMCDDMSRRQNMESRRTLTISELVETRNLRLHYMEGSAIIALGACDWRVLNELDRRAYDRKSGKIIRRERERISITFLSYFPWNSVSTKPEKTFFRWMNYSELHYWGAWVHDMSNAWKHSQRIIDCLRKNALQRTI